MNDLLPLKIYKKKKGKERRQQIGGKKSNM
jgi:hypothetical protein